MEEMFNKQVGETEEQYVWRIGNLIDSGKIENWSIAAPFINHEWRDCEDHYRDEATYRKKYQAAKTMYDNCFSKMIGEDCYKQLQEEKDNLIEAKFQLYDQRREYNKLLRANARAEHIKDELVKAAYNLSSFERKTPFYTPMGDREALAVFADWHYGLVTENIWNSYNIEICKERLNHVVSRMIEHLRENKPKKLHILLLGDYSHGSIHTGCRVASEEKTCNQLMQSSELIAQTIDTLSNEVFETDVHSTYGNHMRTIQSKQDSDHDDNFERVVGWWLKTRFNDRKDINILESDYYEFINFMICGSSICAVHGDIDNFKNIGVMANTLFTKLYGRTIDYTISADKHHLEEFEGFNIESTLVRSLCGTDDYANEHRLYSNPGQTLMIFNPDEGKECTYNIGC